MTRMMFNPESVRDMLNTLVTGSGVGVGVGIGVDVGVGVGLDIGVGEGVSFSVAHPKMLTVSANTSSRINKAFDLLIVSNTPEK